MNIEKTLQERFNAPLQENYKRRIIFWQDPEGEFSTLVDELCLDGVKILKLTGTNNFAAKLLLSETDTESNYLVYNPVSYSDIRDNWLLDVELYSEEFHADLLSIRMQELKMPVTAPMRKAMKSYAKFFENKDRVAKLTALHSEYTTPGQLHIDILAVLAGTCANTAPGVIRALLMGGLDPQENGAYANIRKFGNEHVMWELIQRYTGYVYEEGSTFLPLAGHILLTALSVTMQEHCLQGLEKMIAYGHQQLCYSLINEWLHSEEDCALQEIARAVEEDLSLVRRFDALEIEDLLNSECFPCINECILRRFMTDIARNVIKTEELAAAVEKRRTLKWYTSLGHYYDGLLQVALMQRFRQEHISGFHIAEHTVLWKAYTDEYYKMDHYYRQFHTAFTKSRKETATALEDLYKAVADYVENLYKNWYLAKLGTCWTSLISEELEKSALLPGIPQQSEFYKTYVRPIANGASRVYVIISDALRYEVAADLTGQLIRETKGSAEITALQATFPSVTKSGMAALLPHRVLELTQDGKILCDGNGVDSTAEREKQLQSYHPGSVAMTYKNLLAMTKDQRQKAVSDANVVYIYHNTIDAMGDKVVTEDEVFGACEDAIAELKNLVRIITNTMNGTNILITADHGFLYSYKPLDESDKGEKSFLSGDIIELDRRYVIARGDTTAEHMLKIPLTHLNNDLMGFAPKDHIRMKKQGGGMNYVHGGISLQESVVPVIEFKNMRASSKNFVDVKKAVLQLISQSRKVSNSIFSLDFYQTEQATGKIAAATYDIYMADATGKQISDTKTIIADKTGNNGSERVFRTRFTLKSMEFKKTDSYYLTIVEKGTTNVIDKIEFTIDIAFVNDFDF